MSSDCQAYRDALLVAGLTGHPDSDHASGCASCAGWARSALRIAGEIATLPKIPAPVELQGGVVAALQAGYRQARAVGAVADLGRVSSPPALDEAVDLELEGCASTATEETEAARLRAPGVLDRLVAEELADPSRARARRYLGSLRRKRAPEELRLRLVMALHQGRERWTAGTDGRTSRRLQTGVGLAAAALLVTLGALLFSPAIRSRPPGRAIVLERVADPSDLPPIAAALLDGASGGLLSMEGL